MAMLPITSPDRMRSPILRARATHDRVSQILAEHLLRAVYADGAPQRLVAFSDSDPIFSINSGRRMAERVPGAVDFVPVEGASHFLQEDRGEVLAKEIVRFVVV